MLRLIFVFSIICVGAFYSLRGPFYALLFYLWNAYFRPEFWIWQDWLFGARLSLVIGCFLVLSSLPALARFRWSLQVWLMVLFLAQGTIATVTSINTELCLPFWFEFLKTSVVALLITVLVDDLKKFRLTIVVICLSLSLEAAKQGWAQLILNPGAANQNQHPVLGDNNGVALGMVMLVPLLLALAQTAQDRRERYLFRFFTVGVVYRAISTYSRGGFLAAGVATVLTIVRSPRKIRSIVAVAVVAGVVLAVMPEGFWDRMNTIGAAEEEQDDSARSRLYLWVVAQQMANDRPFTGVGLNGYRYALDQYEGTSYGELRAAHSMWYGTLADLGYPGLLIFIALMLGAILSCVRVRRAAIRDGRPESKVYATQFLTCIVVFAVAGTFLSAQYTEYWWHFLALMVALERIAPTEVPNSGTPSTTTKALSNGVKDARPGSLQSRGSRGFLAGRP